MDVRNSSAQHLQPTPLANHQYPGAPDGRTVVQEGGELLAGTACSR